MDETGSYLNGVLPQGSPRCWIPSHVGLGGGGLCFLRRSDRSRKEREWGGGKKRVMDVQHQVLNQSTVSRGLVPGDGGPGFLNLKN